MTLEAATISMLKIVPQKRSIVGWKYEYWMMLKPFAELANGSTSKNASVNPIPPITPVLRVSSPYVVNAQLDDHEDQEYA
jgi:hypothetical protein